MVYIMPTLGSLCRTGNILNLKLLFGQRVMSYDKKGVSLILSNRTGSSWSPYAAICVQSGRVQLHLVPLFFPPLLSPRPALLSLLSSHLLRTSGYPKISILAASPELFLG